MALTLAAVGFDYAAGTALARTALDGVTLSVSPGELVVVLGPSGAGKTTMLRIAAGLLEPSRGSVEVDGVPAGRGERGVVAIAFQRPETQFFSATVLEDVSFGPRNLGCDAVEVAQAAREALQVVGLDPEAFAPRSPFTLSGGEARRVALAGVLAMRPRYLLLDEPTSGLDVRGRRAVASAVARARTTAGVVVVTHDADEFLGGADRAVVLGEGVQAFGGPVSRLMSGADQMERDGVWTPPEHIMAQLLAIRAGRMSGPPLLDPADAARALVSGGGAS